MSMTKTDYELVAKVLREERNFFRALHLDNQLAEVADDTAETITLSLAAHFQLANPKFDHSRFLAAAGMARQEQGTRVMEQDGATDDKI